MSEKIKKIEKKLEDFNFWEGTDDAVSQLHKILVEMLEVIKEVTNAKS